MNRALWVFTALVALLLALMAGLVILVHAGQSTGSELVVATGESVAAPSPPLMTAREGYLAALPTALEWAEDAHLWRVQATWATGSDLQAPPAAWNYTFYSPGRQATALVSATPEAVKLLGTRPALRAPALAAVEDWQIDSPAAYEQLYQSGGEAFLTVHPQRSMMLTLHLDQPLRWQANLINEGDVGNRAGRQMLSLVFSAQDGRLITDPLPGGANEEE